MLILYHAGCMDGSVAAWAALRRYPDAEAKPVQYGQPPPDVTGKDVLIVDFSYPRDTLLALHAQAKSLRVFDHHKTAAEALAGLDFCVFDMARSGAGITWDELHGGERPWLVDYVEDRDLWRWKLPDSKEINAHIQMRGHAVDAITKLIADGPTLARQCGGIVLAVQQNYLDVTKSTAYVALLDGEYESVPCVNAGPWLASELIGSLAEESPTGYAFGWYATPDGVFRYSLRSRKGVDVSPIAKRFGGGGHARAAGFTTPALVHRRVTSSEG